MCLNKKIAQKLSSLQLRLKVDDFMKNKGEEIFNILKLLQVASIPFKVVSVDGLTEDLIPDLKERFSQKPFADFGLSDITLKNDSYQDEIYKYFPVDKPSSIYYFPKLDTVKPWEPDKTDYLKEFLTQENLPDQKVFVYYFGMGLLLKTQLHELLKTNEEQLFDSYYENIVIHAENFNWLMVFTGDDDRRFGYVCKNSVK